MTVFSPGTAYKLYINESLYQAVCTNVTEHFATFNIEGEIIKRKIWTDFIGNECVNYRSDTLCAHECCINSKDSY